MRIPTHLALVLSLCLLSSSASADDGEVCRRARSVMGADASTASAEACQRALDEVEEESWQLTLDLALAAEKGGDREQAVTRYQRFVDAADRRGARLGASWARQRDDARTAIGRIDQELLTKRARVNISSLPDGAEVLVVSGVAVPGDTEKTPTIRYFTPGTHTVRLRAPATGEARELSFSVERGQTLELKVDLRKDAPTEHGVIEGVGPAMRGQTPGPADEGTNIDRGAVVHALPDEDDGEGPPQTQTTGSTGTTIGLVALSVGIASLAAGTVFLVTGDGLGDEFEACARPGSGCPATASALNDLERDADVQYDRATAAFIAGGVLVVGGVIAMLVFDDVGEVTPDARTKVVPWVAPDGGGLSASLRF